MGYRKSIKYKVDKNGCHICTSHKASSGYPRIMYKGRRQAIIRYLYEQRYDITLKSDQFICHRCDNRLCINLDHVYLGNYSTNVKDKYKRNPDAYKGCKKGGKIGGLKGKLTRDQIRFIRESNLDSKILTKKFNVSQSTISRVKNFKTHKLKHKQQTLSSK